MLKLILLASIVTLTAAAFARSQDRPLSTRLTPQPYQTGRSVVMAKNGMVATSQALATQIGLDVLRAGGSAVDAAIAADAALGLMEPMSCGIGGDLFAIVWDNKTKKLYGLNASGRSPYKATREFFKTHKLKEIPEHGPLSWSVPGCVSGWDELHKKFGKLPLADILRPTIDYANDGFPVTEVIAGSWARQQENLEQIARRPGDLFPRWQGAQGGRRVQEPEPGPKTTRRSPQGPAGLLQGPLAKKIVAYSDKVGGLFTLKDFADHTSTWVEPVSTNYRGYQVWELPPPGQGIAGLADAQHALGLQSQEDGAGNRPTTGTCSWRPRSSLTPTGPASTPTPISSSCRPPN